MNSPGTSSARTPARGVEPRTSPPLLANESGRTPGSTRALRRAYWIAKLGGKCAICDVEDETSPLQFDHVDPASRSFVVANGLTRPVAEIADEVAKCQLLCVTHHKQKTARENGRQTPTHGTLAMYHHGKCRCDECRAAVAAYRKSYRARVGRYGRVGVGAHGGNDGR